MRLALQRILFASTCEVTRTLILEVFRRTFWLALGAGGYSDGWED